MSITPRTDAAEKLAREVYEYLREAGDPSFDISPYVLARTLEIKLAVMQARAEKAEADTARLDWLEKEALEDWGIWSIDRAAIDAAMKEASK